MVELKPCTICGSDRKWSEEYNDLKPCPKCNCLPVRETRRVMLGKVRDGGFTVTQGRYKCPVCGDTPGWGRCYCVDYGWDKNIEVWNKYVEEQHE